MCSSDLINVYKSICWFNNVHFGSNWDNNDWYYDSDDNYDDWKTGHEYIMKADGHLYSLTGMRAGKEEKRPGRTRVTVNGESVEITTDDNSNDDNYRYKNGESMNKVDSTRTKMENEQQKIKDSLQKAKEKIEKQLQKIGDNGNTEPPPLSSQLSVISPMVDIN